MRPDRVSPASIGVAGRLPSAQVTKKMAGGMMPLPPPSSPHCPAPPSIMHTCQSKATTEGMRILPTRDNLEFVLTKSSRLPRQRLGTRIDMGTDTILPLGVVLI
eukprot:6986207-Pyramimonas_sp.AAC.1